MKQGGKRCPFVIAFFLLVNFAYAGQIEERHTFFSRYNPTSGSFVYNQAGSTGTGDVVAVNTYSKKTIFIHDNSTNGKLINYRIEGRIHGVDTYSNWAVLDTGEIKGASADTVKHIAVDVTEYVDFIRVGLQQDGGDTGVNDIDIEGLFTNIDR